MRTLYTQPPEKNGYIPSNLGELTNLKTSPQRKLAWYWQDPRKLRGTANKSSLEFGVAKALARSVTYAELTLPKRGTSWVC